MQRVRMLTDAKVEGLNYKCNQVVDFPTPIARDLVDSRVADAAAEAVAYAIDTLGAEPLVHVSEALRAARRTAGDLEVQLEELGIQFEAEKDAGRRAELGKRGDALWTALKDAKAALAALESDQPVVAPVAAPAAAAADVKPVSPADVQAAVDTVKGADAPQGDAQA